MSYGTLKEIYCNYIRKNPTSTGSKPFKTPIQNYKSSTEYVVWTVQTLIPSPRSKLYHVFNFFEEQKLHSCKLCISGATFLENDIMKIIQMTQNLSHVRYSRSL